MDINSIGSQLPFPSPAQGPKPLPAAPQAAPDAPPVASSNITGTSPRPAAETDAAGKNKSDDQQSQEAFRQKLQESVDELNDFIQPHNTSLRFSIDDESGTVVVKVTDKETQEVIKQIPSEEALELAKALDKLKGLLIQQQA